MSTIVRAVALLALSATVVSAQGNPACRSVAGNLVQNCSFEVPTIPPGATWPNAPMEAWTSSDGLYERWVSGFSGFHSRDGISHAELNVNAPTTLSQYLATSVGQRYQLFFSASHRSGGSAHFSQIDVFVDGVFVTSTGQLTNSLQWFDFTDSFVATSAHSRIEFRGQGSGSYGNHLDNVTVAATVPEPSAAALLLIGGVLVAGARRRRATR
jgi:hypothetical protein